MFLADTLSRAFLPEVSKSEFVHGLEQIDHKTWLPVSDARWQQIVHAASDDPTFQQLRSVIKDGWPNNKSDLPHCLQAYYDIRDELTVQGELVFKGQRLVVPMALRKEMMAESHASHIGVEACIRRARDTLFWPRMNKELKEYITKCDTCMSYRSSQTKEPLQQHEFPARPWSKVAADLCELNGRTLLVVCDYYSNYVEVARVTTLTSKSIIKELKQIFARFGIPDVLVTDNGPQFASSEFTVFTRNWGFEHSTSSPTYPQSNGKAENAVKTIKRLFKKCKESGQSEFLALLNWRNTPTEGIGTSPAQRLMGRRCKTLLPMASTLLKPRYDTEAEEKALTIRRQKQERYYNRSTKPLKPINPGETVRMKLPGGDKWTQGTCTGKLANRSYTVKVGGAEYRRNRRHLQKTNEPPIHEEPHIVEESAIP